MTIVCWVLALLLILGKLFGMIAVSWGFVFLALLFPIIWTIFWFFIGALLLSLVKR